MLPKLRNHLKKRGGFTLAETLITLLILLLVAGIVATGVPVAARTLGRIVDTANAQTLLSTSITRLRSEFGTASDVSAAGNQITYTDEKGNRVVLFSSADSGISLAAAENGGEGDDPKTYSLLSSVESEQKTEKKLIAVYSTADVQNGVLSIGGLKIKNKATEQDLTPGTDIKIRIMTGAS